MNGEFIKLLVLLVGFLSLRLSPDVLCVAFPVVNTIVCIMIWYEAFRFIVVAEGPAVRLQVIWSCLAGITATSVVIVDWFYVATGRIDQGDVFEYVYYVLELTVLALILSVFKLIKK